MNKERWARRETQNVLDQVTTETGVEDGLVPGRVSQVPSGSAGNAKLLHDDGFVCGGHDVRVVGDPLDAPRLSVRLNPAFLKKPAG